MPAGTNGNFVKTLQSLTVNSTLNVKTETKISHTRGHTSVQFSQSALSYLLPKVSICNSKVPRRISNSYITWQPRSSACAIRDVLREIAVHVIRPITRCVGMKRANSVVCIITGGTVFIVMQVCSSYTEIRAFKV